MQRFVKILLSAGLLTAGTGVPLALADEKEVNNVSWELQNNDGGQTTCVAENYNEFPVDAVFDLFPAARDPYGQPMPTQRVVTMQPGVEYNIYNWINASAAGPGPNCTLRYFSVRIP